MLQLLVEKTRQDPELDILLVPVTVLIGQRPSRESGLTRTIFTENWEIGGRIRRFFNTLVNGRKTFVQFSRPISLSGLAAEGLETSVALRGRCREYSGCISNVCVPQPSARISPHRRTMVDRVVNSPTVRSATKKRPAAPVFRL